MTVPSFSVGGMIIHIMGILMHTNDTYNVLYILYKHFLVDSYLSDALNVSEKYFGAKLVI